MKDSEIALRKMKEDYIVNLKVLFKNQGWYRSTQLFQGYLIDQKQNDRMVIIADTIRLSQIIFQYLWNGK